MELHTGPVGLSQSRIVLPGGFQLITADNAYGAKALVGSGKGSSRNMIGIGPSKGKQGVMILIPGRQQVIL